jgi:hypothetical protein
MTLIFMKTEIGIDKRNYELLPLTPQELNKRHSGEASNNNSNSLETLMNYIPLGTKTEQEITF